MALFRSQKRQVPKPDLVGRHQSANPMFEGTPDWSAFRTRVFGYTALGLALTALGFLIYGPWFAIRQVTVSGTRLLNPKSIQQAAEKYLDGQRWLVLPNRTIWILSSPGLSQTLEKQIRRRISVEKVTVEKKAPHDLHIIVAERTPVAIWTNGTSFGSVDKQGKIIEMRTALDASLLTVRDENQTIFSVDSSVVKQEVMSSLQTLAGYLKPANIEVTEYLIPVTVCPTPIVPAVNANTTATSTNVNSSVSNKNINIQKSILNQNVNQSLPVTLPCDREALRYSSQELHARLKDGPRVLFDRHGDLKQAVQALQRVLSERANKVYKTIDVRFGDRVYVQ